MTQRIVVDGRDGWLNLRTMSIFWGEEGGGHFAFAGFASTQLRWMIHPAIGLPLSHFRVWYRPGAPDNLSKQHLANLDGWHLLETVGLPIVGDWQGTGYSLDDQGPPLARLRPVEAARERLKRGAPPIGWRPQVVNGRAVPQWQRPNDDVFLEQLCNGPILDGLREMLLATPAPRQHRDFVQEVAQTEAATLLPHLVLDQTIGRLGGGENPQGMWQPLSLMAISAGSDPLAALALGFGTALAPPTDGEILYMVTVEHELEPGLKIDIADVARANAMMTRVIKPQGLSANRSQTTRPQVIDGPTLETVAVGWKRFVAPVLPVLPNLPPEFPLPVSYAIVRFGWQPEGILLTRRPNDVGGWLSYVPGIERDEVSMAFHDHLIRTEDGTRFGRPHPLPMNLTYAVAGQDLFGRWSDWETIVFVSPMEEPQAPSVLSVALDSDGRLTVDFGWDWSDRSPEFIELIGGWLDEPGVAQVSARIDFRGEERGDPGEADIVALSPDKRPSAWGTAQDAPRYETGTRFYRWKALVQPALNDARWREFGVSARGQRHLHREADPDFGISPFVPPAVTRVWSKLRLDPPSVPALEAPYWASLPDANGISRFTLMWNSVPGAAGYIVYEATESALLSILAPEIAVDTAVAHTTRLRNLRSADIGSAQKSFRRLTREPIPQTVEQVRHEVSLPRGSKVIHFFAITTVTENNIESDWPLDSDMFVAVAVPRLDPPPAPGIAVDVTPEDPHRIIVTVDRNATTGGPIEIYRTSVAHVALDVGTMGPPLGELITDSPTVQFVDDTVVPGWHPHFYRAVAWSVSNNLEGLIEARSAASPAVSILVPPLAPPEIRNVMGNRPFSTDTKCLVGWTSPTPRTRTPAGPHSAVVEASAQAGDGLPWYRFTLALDEIPQIEFETDVAALDEGIFVRPLGDMSHYVAWVPRAGNEGFRLCVKMIDPMSRIGVEFLDVPALETSQRFVIVPAWANKLEVDQGDDMGMTVFPANELGLIVVYDTARHEPGFDHEQVISLNPPAGSVVPAGTVVTVLLNLLG